MVKWSQVLWASFMVAGIAEIAFFTLIDPRTLYLFGERVQYSAITTYSIGFFAFWLICAASCLITVLLLRRADEINKS